MWTKTIGAGASAEFVAEWTSVHDCCNTTSATYTFEVILHASGAIDLVYQSINPNANGSVVGVTKGDRAHGTAWPHGNRQPSAGAALPFTVNSVSGNYEGGPGPRTAASIYTGPITV